MTPVMVAVLAAVIVTIGAVIGIRMLIAAHSRKTAARRAQEARRALREVPPSCRKNGHAYQQHGTGYRCLVCGNYISSHEGEVFGLAAEGRVDRRRDPR